MADTEHHLLRFTLDDGSTLEPAVRSSDADAIFAARIDGNSEVRIPHAFGTEPFPLPRDELVSVETVLVHP